VDRDGQAVTSLSREGRYQLDQEEGQGAQKQGLGGEGEQNYSFKSLQVTQEHCEALKEEVLLLKALGLEL